MNEPSSSRLSADELFHFKQDISIVCQILKSGFRHNLWPESLPFGNTYQFNFICSFCDILPQHSEGHSSVYGKNLLGLTKEWGIRSGVSPVRYIHQSSVGVSQQYQAAKMLWRGASELQTASHEDNIRDYQYGVRLMSGGYAKDGKIAKSVESDPEAASALQKVVEEYVRGWGTLTTREARQFYTDSINDLFNQVILLHNELETRDAFVRAYAENFKASDGLTHHDKVLYDEREWRSLRTMTAEDDNSHMKVYTQAIKDKFLPLEYNLRFTSSDLAFVVVEEEQQKEIVLDFLSQNQCLVSADEVRPRLQTFGELVAKI